MRGGKGEIETTGSVCERSQVEMTVINTVPGTINQTETGFDKDSGEMDQMNRLDEQIV